MTFPAEKAPGRTRLLEQLMAVVRSEFRTEIYVPAPDDPVFIADECAVTDCDRTAASARRGLCNAHDIRFRKRGRPPMTDFLAEPGPPVRGRRSLAACVIDGCHYGRRAKTGLCSKHHDRWSRAGKPDPATWNAPDLAPRDTTTSECRLPFCNLWVENPAKLFCTGHDDRWHRHGHPDPDHFIADCELVGTASIDLRDLAPQLKLEIQYALQCRHDACSRTAAPRLVMPAVRRVKALGVASLLDLSEQQWRQKVGAQADESALFLLDARDGLEALRDGTGWEIEYPRDVWRLHKLPGITTPAGRPCPRARLRFDRIPQYWLRELGKRWTRLRLTSGLSIGAARAGVDALICFGGFLTSAGVDALAEVNRPLLERYLAHVMSQPGGHGMKKTRIGALNLFFQNIRQYGWEDTLSGTAAFYVGDVPPVPEQVDRRLAEYVMTQIESPGNLDRWPDAAGRLVTLILTRCGLRISSALALDFDCFLHDGQGAPYLRYFNTKMRREAAVPIDEELEAAIREQQRRVLDQWPDGTACLFPRQRANVSGNLPLADGTYRRMLGRWLETCDIRDEHGRPVHLTPHQWRHTFACRLINRDVPQEVVRVLLDHDSHKMTSHYAKITDQTVRRHWQLPNLDVKPGSETGRPSLRSPLTDKNRRGSHPTMLYYPLVQPPQAAVHQALLYWDGIASLVPGDSDVQDEAVSSELRDLQERHLYHPITLEEEYRGLLRRSTAGLPALADALIEISGRQIPRDWILSYNGKWNDAEVLNSLVDLGLARRVRNPTSFKSLAMPREVVTLLTATMAHEVARSSVNRAYTPYTDQQAPDQVALGCDQNTGVAAWRVRLGHLLPTPSPVTTTQQILEFREKYAAERERLLCATQEMLVELCRNWEHPADVLRRMELELTSAREDYMDAAKSRRIAWTERSLYATVAVASTAAGALIAPDLSWVAGILGSVGFNVATREIRPLRACRESTRWFDLDFVEVEESDDVGWRAEAGR